MKFVTSFFKAVRYIGTPEGTGPVKTEFAGKSRFVQIIKVFVWTGLVLGVIKIISLVLM